MISAGVKWYGVAVGVVLLMLWVVWPLRPSFGDREDFTDQCQEKRGDVAELVEGSGLVCVRRKKVVLREYPLPPVRLAGAWLGDH